MSRKFPLKAVLILAFLPVVILPLLLTGVTAQWRYQTDTQAVQREIQEDLVQVGATRQKLIRGLLGNAEALVETMAEVWPELSRVGDPNEHLQRLAFRSRIFTQIAVVGPEGRVRYSSAPAAVGESVAGEAWWQTYRQRNSLTISGLLRDAQGRRVIRILAPLAGGETLVASYNTDQLQAAFRNLQAQEIQRFTVLVDGDGNVIAHSDEATLLLGPNLRTLPPVQRGLLGFSGAMEFRDPTTGDARDAAYLPIPLAGWALILTQPTAESILTPAAITNRINVLTLILSLLFAMGATLLLSRRLSTPIERFSQRVEQLSHEPASPERLAEFPGSPIVEYDRVLESIRRLYASLARSILELEAKNSELIFTNQQLSTSVENLKRLDRLRSEFINILSHDLRIPLTAIIGYAELLEDSPEVPEQDKHYVRQIFEGCNRMQDQLNELLDYARLEVGRFKLDLQPVDLQSTIPETVAFFRPLAERKDLRIELELGPEIPEVWVDPDRLLQILNNLISNAIKYTPSGGTVTVRASTRNDRLVLEVQDTGIGLTDEDREHLFEKFYRSSRREVRSEMGSGIGLSLVKGVIEAHGGSIEAEGAPGKGSTFRVTLPLKPPVTSGEAS